jgi:hypothetical protein
MWPTVSSMPLCHGSPPSCTSKQARLTLAVRGTHSPFSTDTLCHLALHWHCQALFWCGLFLPRLSSLTEGNLQVTLLIFHQLQHCPQFLHLVSIEGKADYVNRGNFNFLVTAGLMLPHWLPCSNCLTLFLHSHTGPSCADYHALTQRGKEIRSFL